MLSRRAPQASAIARLARPQSSSVSCGHPKGLDYNTGICSASPLPSLSWAWLIYSSDQPQRFCLMKSGHVKVGDAKIDAR